ncbi:MAG: NDP-hexose 2,3-dehydratase family protein [Thermoanaerobaculia bacterium]|nr:NDP-hexose 2,3-dehydratase family protein [Thermoanaerobaculia bacterium]
MTLTLDLIVNWFSSRLADAECRLEWMPLAGSADWCLEDGVVTHRSKGFFTIVGLRWTSPAGDFIQRPFLDQQEIGTLGFLMRERDGGRQLLVHAKIEPGNVGLVQLAPTCQATDSNARRLHGGDSPPFIDSFPPAGPDVLYDVAQSEQGTRFLRKRNRNALVLASGEAPVPDTHRWLDVDSVLDLMWQDYLVNTDARSVLVCAPWQPLVNRVPFSRYGDGFGSELAASLHSSSRHVSLEGVKQRVRGLRITTEDPNVVSLDALLSWHWSEEGLSPVDGGSSLRVRHVGVTVKGREVPAWDQPIVDSGSAGIVLLACARLDGILHFLFRAHAEPGLDNRVELTPTLVIEPGDAFDETHTRRWPGKVVAQVRQSEEGGRFYRDTNTYRVVDAGMAGEVDPDSYWLTLGDVRQLLDEPGWLTNEARSALSLLLPWM